MQAFLGRFIGGDAARLKSLTHMRFAEILQKRQGDDPALNWKYAGSPIRIQV
jgi:hypothetical protein